MSCRTASSYEGGNSLLGTSRFRMAEGQLIFAYEMNTSIVSSAVGSSPVQLLKMFRHYVI